ncbi:hypothetical protein ACSBR2_025708 [Camellia fascicularis]
MPCKFSTHISPLSRLIMPFSLSFSSLCSLEFSDMKHSREQWGRSERGKRRYGGPNICSGVWKMQEL